MRPWASSIAACATVSAGSLAWAGLAPDYSPSILRLTGTEYADSSGISTYHPTVLPSTASGPLMAGWVELHPQGTSGIASAGWAWDGSTMHRAGLTGSGYLDYRGFGVQGLPSGKVTGVSATQLIAGESARYLGRIPQGEDAWVYDGAATYLVGITDAEHTVGGMRHSAVTTSGTSNYVLGTTLRSFGNGQTQWAVQPGMTGGYKTVRLGLTMGDYSSGQSASSSLTAAVGNHVVGHTNCYEPSPYGTGMNTGRDAWIWSGGLVSRRIGVTSGTHVSGYRRHSEALNVNSQGVAVGFSYNNYDATKGWLGSTAWVQQASTVQELGLNSPEHRGSLNQTRSTASYINESGMVAGHTHRLSASDDTIGTDSWVYEGSAYRQPVFVGLEYRNASGNVESSPSALLADGSMVGLASRFDAGASRGNQPFVMKPSGETIMTGIVDARHRRADGSMFHAFTHTNNPDLVVGTTTLYNSSGDAGSSTWILDVSTGQTIVAALSDHPLDHSGMTVSTFVTPDGWVGGYFDDYYDEAEKVNSRSTGWLWSGDTGFVSMDSLVALAGDPSIERIAAVQWVSPSKDIYTIAALADGSQVPLVLTAVPEPGLMVLGGVAVASSLLFRRRPRRDTRHGLLSH